jgi:hypothetical protein
MLGPRQQCSETSWFGVSDFAIFVIATHWAAVLGSLASLTPEYRKRRNVGERQRNVGERR